MRKGFDTRRFAARLARFVLLLLTVAFGGYFVGVLDGHDRPLEHIDKP